MKNRNRIKTYSELITESINDKHLLKACILTGGPGSGKSYITDKMFKGLPVVFVDSDKIFEIKLKQFGLSLKLHTLSPKDAALKDDLRAISRELTGRKKDQWINSLLPLVINGTGRNYDIIKKQKEDLNALGYDLSMIFINTSLDLAMERNEKRERTIEPKAVHQMWNEVQQNIGAFQTLFNTGDFPGDFYIIDNNEKLEGSAQDLFIKKLNSMARTVINSPLENRIGISLLDFLKTNGLKYRSDYFDFIKEK